MAEPVSDVPAINTPWYADKSFLAVILSPVLLFIGKKLGVEFNAVEIAAIFSALISFVCGTKWKTTVLTKQAMVAEAGAAGMAAPTAPVLNR